MTGPAVGPAPAEPVVGDTPLDATLPDEIVGDHPAGDLPVALELVRAVEAMVMVADSPLEPHLIGELLELPPDIIEEICACLAHSYEEENRGFRLARVAGGYRFESHPDLAPWVERYVLVGQVARLSAAALETLAIIAYKQPISRAQMSAIRGVSVDGVVRTLTQRGYIDEVARDPGPGQAVLYGTTSEFLERLGLDSVDDLPPIADFVPGAEIMEALENSLRVDPEVADTPDQRSDDLADEEPAEEATDPAVTDEVVIDLRDEAADPLGDLDETIDHNT
ncbi:MAG: SMC-Scp complex subunit ScpB [Actinomycetia bacterium]|nr:SMC-Scp complex subunit ScpB [Actinomycetes bacterium]MCP4084209.1 SMC-Scp complex subunit ScpB [Actinomycetes bacterium]